MIRRALACALGRLLRPLDRWAESRALYADRLASARSRSKGRHPRLAAMVEVADAMPTNAERAAALEEAYAEIWKVIREEIADNFRKAYSEIDSDVGRAAFRDELQKIAGTPGPDDQVH